MGIPSGGFDFKDTDGPCAQPIIEVKRSKGLKMVETTGMNDLKGKRNLLGYGLDY